MVYKKVEKFLSASSLYENFPCTSYSTSYYIAQEHVYISHFSVGSIAVSYPETVPSLIAPRAGARCILMGPPSSLLTRPRRIHTKGGLHIAHRVLEYIPRPSLTRPPPPPLHLFSLSFAIARQVPFFFLTLSPASLPLSPSFYRALPNCLIEDSFNQHNPRDIFAIDVSKGIYIYIYPTHPHSFTFTIFSFIRPQPTLLLCQCPL